MIKFKLRQLMAEKEFNDGVRITLQKISDDVGIGRSTLSKMANNKNIGPQLETIEKLCTYFDCTPNDLITIIPDKPKAETQSPHLSADDEKTSGSD